MHFLKTKLIYILIGFMALLGSIAVLISIRISVTMIEKQDQLVKTGTDAAAALPREDAGPTGMTDIQKALRYPVFFNGEEQQELDYYAADKDNALLPLDIILRDLGFDYRLYNSDDLFKANINGKALLLQLDTNKGTYGGKDLALGVSTIAASNHIMVSPEILDLVSGVNASLDSINRSYFINYWPSSKNSGYSGIRLLHLSNGVPYISDLFGGSAVRYGKGGPAKADDMAYDPELSSYIFKSNGKFYYINGRNYKKPGVLYVDSSYQLSADGRFLYREVRDRNALYVYNIKTGVEKKLKDYLTGDGPEGEDLSSGFSLMDFHYGKRYSRLDFKASDKNSTYTVLERNSKVVEEGSSSYSPDSGRILFYRPDEGWSLSDFDGTDTVRLESASSAVWVDNDRIQVVVNGSRYIYDIPNKTYTPVQADWHFIGKTSDGGVFFVKGDALYQAVGDSDKKICDFTWGSDYMSAASSKGPYILLSDKKNGIFCISGSTQLLLGDPALFPERLAGSSPGTLFERNSARSPDGGKLAILQNGNSYLEVCILDLKKMSVKKLVLNLPVASKGSGYNVGITWADNSRLLVYTSFSGWTIDMKKGTYINEWFEPGADVLKGVLHAS